MTHSARTLLLLLLAMASTASAQPGDLWIDEIAPTFVGLGDLTDQPGLEAVYWDRVSSVSPLGDLVTRSLASGQDIGTLPTRYEISATQLYLADLDEGTRTELVVYSTSFDGSGSTEVSAWQYIGNGWTELWNLPDVFPAAPSSVVTVDLNGNSRGELYLMVIGPTEVQLFDPMSGALVWNSQDVLTGPNPYSLTTWTQADFDGDARRPGEELLFEFADVVSGDRALILLGQSAVGTSVGPLQSTLVRMGSSQPNPMQGESTIDFDLPRPTTVRLRVVDARGRHVATVHQGPTSQGRHLMRWNGRDDRGRSVSAGVYFYELSADGQSQSRKMVVLR